MGGGDGIDTREYSVTGIARDMNEIRHLIFHCPEMKYQKTFRTSEGVAILTEKTEDKERIKLTMRVNRRVVQRYYDVADLRFVKGEVVLGRHSADILGAEKYVIKMVLEHHTKILNGGNN